MLGANVTMRSLRNTDTGIDITVPNIEEVEAPLGGKSTEYEICVFTNLELYKSDLHSKEDVIHFSVYKAYKEVEDFYDRVVKKFGNGEIPSIPKGCLVVKCSVEDKRNSLDRFMQYISQQKEICDSSLFTQFTGINKRRQSRSSVSESFSEVPLNARTSDADVQNVPPDNQNETDGYHSNEDGRNQIPSQNSELEADDHKISELFPKMKVRKSSRTDAVDEENNIKETVPSTLLPEKVIIDEFSQNDDLDLFEEDKKTKIKGKKENRLFDIDVPPHQGLFDSFEDDSSNLFLPSETKRNSDKNSVKSSEAVSSISTNSSSVEVKPDNSNEGIPDLFSFDSNISNVKTTKKKQQSTDGEFRENKLFGDQEEVGAKKTMAEGHSLFEEQDFGTSITTDDERLFFVEKNESKNTIVNPLLSPTTETVSDDEVTETLEELTTLSEPTADLPKTEPTSSVKEKKLPPKPAPRPRQKPSDSSSKAIEKPPVAPRNVFPSNSKPPLQPKPVPPPKPKPPAKPSTIAQKESKETVHPSVVAQKQKNTFDDLSSLDILQYIEQEEKTANAEASLFD